MNQGKVMQQRFWDLWKRSGAIGIIPLPVSSIIQQPIPHVRYNEFLYPISRQFPFDEVCEQIVRELEKRNWSVPGIAVKFSDYGSGDQKLRCVSSIEGNDFKLRFCRVQRTLPGSRYNDIAAVTELIIPKKELHVYEDESGPTFYLYVGKDWRRDRKTFMNGLKVHSKMDGRPRTYLRYKGACNCDANSDASFGAVELLTSWMKGDKKALRHMTHTHSGRRPPLLVHDNDLGREYEPKKGEPTAFQTAHVMEEFTSYLKQVILPMILRRPEAATPVNYCADPSPVDFPWLALTGELFTFGEWQDAERIKQGLENPNKLVPSNRFGLQGSGHRLVPFDIKSDGTFPELAYDGFLWCGLAPAILQVRIEDLNIPGHYRWADREQYVIHLRPKTANGIYIADHGLYEKKRAEIGQTLGDRDRFTDEEVAEFKKARARSFMPISEYCGGFSQPVVLINREITFDEIVRVSGPHK